VAELSLSYLLSANDNNGLHFLAAAIGLLDNRRPELAAALRALSAQHASALYFGVSSPSEAHLAFIAGVDAVCTAAAADPSAVSYSVFPPYQLEFEDDVLFCHFAIERLTSEAGGQVDLPTRMRQIVERLSGNIAVVNELALLAVAAVDLFRTQSMSAPVNSLQAVLEAIRDRAICAQWYETSDGFQCGAQ
jgi:hypothetical protein